MKDENFLKENNARHLWHPMGHPGDAQKHAPTIISSASGCTIEDIDGHKAIDAVAGLWCVNIGYGRQEMADAIAKQVMELPYYNPFALTAEPAAALSRRLAEMAPGDLTLSLD